MLTQAPLEIQLEIPDMKQIASQLGDMKQKAPIVMARAINRTETHLCVQIAKEVKKKYAATRLRTKDIKNTLHKEKASPSDLKGTVFSTTEKRIPLYRFLTNPKEPVPKNPPKFYQSQVLKDGSLKNLSGNPGEYSKAFIAKMTNKDGSEHFGVFERDLNPNRELESRKYKKPKRQIRPKLQELDDEKRQPLVELTGPAIPQMIKAERVSDVLIKDANEFLQRQIKHDIAYFLKPK